MKPFFFLLTFLLVSVCGLQALESLPEAKVEYQPFISATERLLDALRFVGAPLTDQDEKAIRQLLTDHDQEKAVRGIQKVLDAYCIAGVHINPEGKLTVEAGPVNKKLVQQGWRTFLVKVYNRANNTSQLVANSPNALPQFRKSNSSKLPSMDITPAQVANRWLDLSMVDQRPLNKNLSGLSLEYQIIQLFSRDVGRRQASLRFTIGEGANTQENGNEVTLNFQCVPAVDVVLGISDFDGKPSSAAFVIRDEEGRIYPNPSRRIAPDFFFHDQVYRADGESVQLPPGKYRITVSRGPEYLPETREIIIPVGIVSQRIDFHLKRWIHPAALRWFSGDHHVHAAGCAHYENPTEGVAPVDMMRHILGEDLNVGCVLTWGPCWYAQKEYFEGKVSALSKDNSIMRYDVEVSGFPSSHAGHVCLLRLTEDDYPGTTTVEEWPTWTLPVLQWGRKQGGIVGYAHTGWGLGLPDLGRNGERLNPIPYPKAERYAARSGKAADQLPDFAVPPFDGVGANEYIVTVTQDACDFISAVDTPAIWELNIWYHTLNCGFRTRVSGETDFPCIYGDKVGMGRVYVKLDEDQPLDFDTWINGVKDGRSYVGDGRSHIFNFKVDEVAVGEPGSNGNVSQLNLKKPEKVKVSFDVSALLQPQPTKETESIKNSRLDDKPFWHIERCRVDNSRNVAVEIIVNGYAVAKRDLLADGSINHMDVELKIEQSSWVAVRILPSVHTNPVFIEVAGKPIRASKRSAEWCLEAVDTCWESKQGQFADSERKAAQMAYNQAKEIYKSILKESDSL
jgi:hypothetical protein